MKLFQIVPVIELDENLVKAKKFLTATNIFIIKDINTSRVNFNNINSAYIQITFDENIVINYNIKGQAFSIFDNMRLSEFDIVCLDTSEDFDKACKKTLKLFLKILEGEEINSHNINKIYNTLNKFLD